MSDEPIRKPTRKPNRRPASKHLIVIDNLLEAMARSDVNRVVIAELIGIEYITLDKYLRKERNVNDEEVAKRMVVTTELLNKLVHKGKLPIPDEVNSRLRSTVIFGVIEDFIKGVKP